MSRLPKIVTKCGYSNIITNNLLVTRPVFKVQQLRYSATLSSCPRNRNSLLFQHWWPLTATTPPAAKDFGDANVPLSITQPPADSVGWGVCLRTGWWPLVNCCSGHCVCYWCFTSTRDIFRHETTS